MTAAGTPSIAAPDINGGTSWDGWTFQGNSNTSVDGIWADDSTERSFDVYTTFFTLDGSETASGDLGTTVLGLDEKNGTFASGNQVLGIGAEVTDEDPDGSFGTAATWKFDPDKNSYAPASSVGADDGKSSSSSFSDEGDFNIQANGKGGVTDPSDKTNEDGEQSWTPSGFFRNDGSGIQDFDRSALFASRGFAQQSNGDPSKSSSFQLLTDIDALGDAPWSVNVGSDTNMVLGVGGTDIALKNVDASATQVPVPATLALMGVGLMCFGLSARRRRLGQT